MDKQHSLSIIRSYLRHVISTIVYNQFSLNHNDDTIQKGKRIFENETPPSKDNEHDFINSDRAHGFNSHSKVESSDRLAQDRFQHCFIDKSFCGMDDLKFIDVVDENDIIKDDNIFKITQWLEIKVFPLLDQEKLVSMNFVSLSIPVRAGCQCGDASLEIFKFKFQSLMENERSAHDSLSIQIQRAISSVIELLQSNKEIRNQGNNNDKDCRLQLCINFVLEYKLEGESRKTFGSMHSQSTDIKNNMLLENCAHLFKDHDDDMKDPLNDITNEVSIKLNTDMIINVDELEKCEIVEFDDDHTECNNIEKTSSSECIGYQILAQKSQDDEENNCKKSLSSSDPNNLQDISKCSPFKLIHKIISSHHRVLLYHSQFDIRDVSSVKTLGCLFEQLPGSWNKMKKDSFSVSNENKAIKRLSEKKLTPTPPLTPMRLRNVTTVGPFRCNASKRITDERDESHLLPPRLSSKLSHSFVTPNNKPVKRKKSPYTSSDAPTIRLSCMSSTSPLFSSVTPPNKH